MKTKDLVEAVSKRVNISLSGQLPCVRKLKLKCKLKHKRKHKIKPTAPYQLSLLPCVLKLNRYVHAINRSVSDFLRLRRPTHTLYGSKRIF